jgi:hypothetical protein
LFSNNGSQGSHSSQSTIISMFYGVNLFLEGSHGSQLALEGSPPKKGTGGNFFSCCRQWSLGDEVQVGSKDR